MDPVVGLEQMLEVVRPGGAAARGGRGERGGASDACARRRASSDADGWMDGC